MRVLHVTSTFPRDDADTVGPFLGDLVAVEREAGLHVRVIAPHAAGLASRDAVHGVGVRRFRYGPAPFERLGYGPGLMADVRSPSRAVMVPAYLAGLAWAVRAEARGWQPDVIHAHWWFPSGMAVAVAAPSRVPVVLTLHGSDVAIAERRVLRGLARAVLRRADAVVAVSDALATTARELTGVAVGVARMPVMGSSSARPPRQPGPLRVLAVGRLAPEKGFDVLIDAAARLIGADVSIEIVGEGTLHDDLVAQVAARGVGDRVRLFGPLSRSAYRERLREVDVVVVPSRREGLGLVAVEAIVAGTPVIASAVGGLPSVLAGDGVGPAPGGVLVPPEDPDALAAALRSASTLPPPGRAAVDAAGHHAPASVAARHLELYQGALDAGR